MPSSKPGAKFPTCDEDVGPSSDRDMARAAPVRDGAFVTADGAGCFHNSAESFDDVFCGIFHY